MTVIGITGPTGSGKTTALAALERLGFQVVDCDALYYRVLDRDQALREGLQREFGPVFLPDGKLDRPVLGNIVFASPTALDRLNALVYPAMSAAVGQIIENCSGKGVVIDAINLVESGLGDLCDWTVALTAPPEVRLRRIMARGGISEERARARMAAQKPDRFYRRHCTFLLENRAGSRAEFDRLVEDFFKGLLCEDVEE